VNRTRSRSPWRPGFSAKPYILDLITDGQGGAPETPLLTTLNPGTDGPDRATAAYYSPSANDYAAEAPPVGDIANYVYTKAVPPDGVVNDGLVAVYSAQSPVLGLQAPPGSRGRRSKSAITNWSPVRWCSRRSET